MIIVKQDIKKKKIENRGNKLKLFETRKKKEKTLEKKRHFKHWYGLLEKR